MQKKILILSLIIVSYFGCFGQQNIKSFYNSFHKQTQYPATYNFLNYDGVIKRKDVINFLPFEKNEKKDVEYRAGVIIDNKDFKVAIINKIYLEGDNADNLEASHIILCVFTKSDKIIDSKLIAREAEDEENNIKILQKNIYQVETDKHQIDLRKGKIIATKKSIINYSIDFSGKINISQ